MPIYEYFCEDCDKAHEVTQRISDKKLKKCPVCGSERIRKLVSLSSFHLKGSGWYVTDYKGKNPGNGNGQASEGSDSASVDAKPAKDDTGGEKAKSDVKSDAKSKSASKPDSAAGTSA